MTRETKIGLLVGLGFIVVFAVLLSHNGSVPSPTASLSPINPPAPERSRPETPGELTPPRPLTPEDTHRTSGSGTPGLIDPMDGALAGGSGSELPAPSAFDTSAFMGGSVPLQGNTPADGLARAEPRDADLAALERRVAPRPVEPPTPTENIRPITPSETLAPSGDPAAPGTTPGTTDSHAAVAVVAAPKPYVVKKGDTLVAIAREVYNNSSPKVIDFLVEANRATIKNRHFVVEGQALATPPLPADMFEPVQTHDVSGRSSESSLASAREALNQMNQNRRAPRPAPVAGPQTRPSAAPAGKASEKPANKANEKPAARPGESRTAVASRGPEKQEKSRKPENPGRWYEIRPNDTFSSIAERHLGSRNRWDEIKQMNKDIDPSKMKPGTRIRLPSAREPVSESLSSKRVSA